MRGERFAGSLGITLSLVLFLPGRTLESASFIRGDADASGQIDITDAIRVLGYLFQGTPASPDCEDAFDADASLEIDISDGVYLLSFLFIGGEPPKAPFPDCGAAAGGLGCASYPGCGPTPSSFDLIGQALAAGEISEEAALLYRIFHVFGDPRLPAAFRGASSGLKDTHLITEALERFGELSEEGRAAVTPFFLPPPAPGSWLEGRPLAGGGSVEWETVVSPSGKVKIWSQTRHAGDAARAETIAGAVDGIWDQLTGLMHREPLSDDGVSDPNGGDGKFDIYLVRLQSASGETHVYPTGYSCSSPNPAYLLIDGRDSSCLLSTVAHEFMHAIQRAYGRPSGCVTNLPYRWWGEASATWAEDYLYRERNECQDALPFLSMPEEPLEFSGRPYDVHHLHPYAAYLWPYYLMRHSGSPDYVRTIWENCERFGSALEAIDQSVPDGFRRWWPTFALYNWNDHPQYNYRHDNFAMPAWRADPATGKPKPEGETETPVTLGGQPEVHIPLFAKVQHLSSIYYHFTFRDDEVRYVSFEHFFDPQTHPTARVQAMVQMKDDADYTYEDWTETPVRSFCRDKANQRLDNLVIILTNSEWKDRTHTLDPANPPVLYARNQCFPGSWTGTISHVTSYEDDITYHYTDGTSKFVRDHERYEDHWEIGPRVIGVQDGGCETFVVREAAWTGSHSVDTYVEDHERCSPGCSGTICIETSTQLERIDRENLPSGMLFDRRCAEVYHVQRIASLGAPPYNSASQSSSHTDVTCHGTFVIPLPDLQLRENWGRASSLIFEVTDPSTAQVFRGEEVRHTEKEPSGPLDEGLMVYTDTWTWNLVREPD